MSSKRLFILVLLANFAIDPTFAREYPFPGKGSKSTWHHANEIFNQAIKFHREGKIDLALKQYQAAIKIYPYDWSYYDNLGHLYEDNKHDLKKAGEAYRNGIKIDPSAVHIRLSYAGLLLEQDKLGEARRAIEQAAKLRQISEEDRLSIDKARKLLDTTTHAHR